MVLPIMASLFGNSKAIDRYYAKPGGEVQSTPSDFVPTPFDREGWLFEIKWDGFRAIAEKDQTGTVLYSRNHRDFTKRFPPIVQAVSALKDNVILDGEIVALDDRGHARFEWLVNRGPQKGILIYHVFDLQPRQHRLRTEPPASENNNPGRPQRPQPPPIRGTRPHPRQPAPRRGQARHGSHHRQHPSSPQKKDHARPGTGKIKNPTYERQTKNRIQTTIARI